MAKESGGGGEPTTVGIEGGGGEFMSGAEGGAGLAAGLLSGEGRLDLKVSAAMKARFGNHPTKSDLREPEH